jgi:5-methyltetrahydrofolate--homocysteine methyltransferase
VVYHVEEFANAKASPIRPHGKARVWRRFHFPRQAGGRRQCIADFFRAVGSGEYDVLGLQLVTMGARVSEVTEELRKGDHYQDYLYLHGLSVESAEALAEMWHKRMRQEMGFGAEDAATVRELFQQKYRGSRYSFGYPACPDLEQRAVIIDLLGAADIGVSLSETFMLAPEQSTDAMVVHHPGAKYFDVKP